MVRSLLPALLPIGALALACSPKPSPPAATPSGTVVQPAPARPAPTDSPPLHATSAPAATPSTPTDTPTEQANAASAPTPAATAPPDAASTPAAVDGWAAARPTASTPPPQTRFSSHYPLDQSVQLLTWKKEHHASGPTFDQRCWELPMPVGSPPAPGLLCTAENRQPEFTLARIYRLDGSTLREVWSATVATYLNWLELTPIVAPDGLSLELRDRTPGSCYSAIAEYRAKRSALKPPPSGELLEPACSKVGTYLYQNGAFRLQATTKRSSGWGSPPMVTY